MEDDISMSKLDMVKIEKTMKALRKNNMQAYFCETAEQAKQQVQQLIKEGDTITHGGSETLFECGIPDMLKNGAYTYLDRNAPGLTKEQIEEIYIKAFSADVFLTSTNAITENGMLFNVDGNSNRTAAILYGPKSVIVVAGFNKIVKDINEAFDRLRTTAAPKNTQRLHCNTYCEKTGKCVSLNKTDSLIGDGCGSDQRICCNYVISALQRHKDRIKVIIVGEPLGY